MRRLHLNRPEFIYQPTKIFRRLFRDPQHIERCRTSWGIELEVDTSDVIGRSVFNTGVYDIAVTEILWRLISPGQFAVDVGANIGYTAGICSIRTGKGGQVYVFEPNPLLLKRLKLNLTRMPYSNVRIFEFGLSDVKHIGKLVLPEDYAGNQGIAFVDDSAVGNHIEIQLERLDDIVPVDRTIDVLKIDVEGHEFNVLAGCTKLLEEKRVTHIVFEEHGAYPSKATTLLAGFGYSIYRLEKGWTRIILKDPSSASSVSAFEPTNYLATLNNAEVRKKIGQIGYRCLVAGRH